MKLDTVSMDLVAKVSVQNTNYDSYLTRRRFRNDTDEMNEYYAEKIGEIEKSKTINYDRIEVPLSIFFETRFETEQLGNNIVVKPLLNLPISKNSLTQEERTYPVDFIYPWEAMFESILEIPANYTTSGIPESYQLDNDLAQINLNYSIKDNILQVKGNYKFKKPTYVASEYAQIKDYFDQIVNKFNQPIVLEKGD